MRHNFLDMNDDFLAQFLRACEYARRDNFRNNREEPVVRKPKVDMENFSDDMPECDGCSGGETCTHDSGEDTIEQLQSALLRQINETNRMNDMYVAATKKISRLENENAAYKAQLEKFYKIQAVMNGD